MSARPIQLPSDLAILPDLIYRSFQYPDHPEWGIQEDEAITLRDDINLLRKMYPFMRILGIFLPALRDSLNGFVWEEDGKPVGLVNATPRGLDSGAWVIGNVSVLPEYRRRGIARKLVEACMELVRQRKAKTVMLDVIAQNIPAYELYQSLGFVHYSGSTEIEFAPTPRDLIPLPEGYRLTEINAHQWQPAFELALRTVPEQVKTFQPIVQKNFQLPLLLRVLEPIITRRSGRQTKRFYCYHQETMIAAVRISARTKTGGANGLSLRLDPQYSHLAQPLLSFALHHVAEVAPNHRTELGIAGYQTELLDAAKILGGKIRTQMHALGLKLA